MYRGIDRYYIYSVTADPISSAPFSRIPLLKIEHTVKPRGKYEFPPPRPSFEMFQNYTEKIPLNLRDKMFKKIFRKMKYPPPQKKNRPTEKKMNKDKLKVNFLNTHNTHRSFLYDFRRFIFSIFAVFTSFGV